MPMGLNVGTALCQTYINAILENLLSVNNYLAISDDLLILSTKKACTDRYE